MQSSVDLYCRIIMELLAMLNRLIWSKVAPQNQLQSCSLKHFVIGIWCGYDMKFVAHRIYSHAHQHNAPPVIEGLPKQSIKTAQREMNSEISGAWTKVFKTIILGCYSPTLLIELRESFEIDTSTNLWGNCVQSAQLIHNMSAAILKHLTATRFYEDLQ